MTTRLILLSNATIVDGTRPDRREDHHVLVEGGTIREVSDRPITAASADALDLRGRTLMPGLIDCHVHVIASLVNLSVVLSESLMTLRALPILRGMLERGFTTVRDAGGADYGLAQAIEQGLAVGPRLFVPGKALSQTGGHGDSRSRFDDAPVHPRGRPGGLNRIADGVEAVRLAAREELRAGAHQVKVMASGGVASPTDPIANTQYSREELTAVVEEAEAAQTYVMAHAYTAKAMRRAVECGIRTIEHGNLVDDATAALMAERGAYAVPTLVTYEALADEGASLGLPPDSVAKIADVRESGLRSLEIFRRAGVKMAYGTDLLGEMHRHQSSEFAIRSRVLSPFEVIQSATTVAAEVLRMDGRLGVVAPGAIADLLVVDGDPLSDLRVLLDQGAHLQAIMKAGSFYKNQLAS
ncbi:MAG TPA: amidohydrolase family protein [bacterium]|nr:amidohydrolase family protein [bacterium]